MYLKRITSGVQPSGILHLGNYLGAIQKWKNYIIQYHNSSTASDIQDINSKLVFFLADNHSITTKFLKEENNYASSPQTSQQKDNISNDSNSSSQNPIPDNKNVFDEGERLKNLVNKTAACLIASGINPEKCIFFRQSDIKQHSELMWVLSCITPQSWLNKMIQFKEKSKNNQLITSIGLYTYPILMAADILLYNSEIVPVGEDQIQHMELTRNIAARLNKLCKQEVLFLPQYEVNEQGSKIMSLQNARNKMSKSDTTKNSCINLLNNADEIRTLILKAKTDPINKIYYDIQNRPEVSNLINIYSCLSGLNYRDIELKFENKSFYEFKLELVKILSQEILPISEKANTILSNSNNGYLEEVLHKGSLQASKLAEENLSKVKKLLHF